MEKCKVAIIGCGSIGALKDDKFDSFITENVFTHAHAAYAHPDAELVGFVDINSDRGHNAAGKWGGVYCQEIGTIFSEKEIDIAIVATPTETHHQVVIEAAHHNPKLIIIEKPFTENKKDCMAAMCTCNKKKIPLLVNYTRRFDVVTQRIKEIYDHGIFGKAQVCTIWYNRGLKRDGCHALDFIQWFFGKFIDGVIKQPELGIPDFSQNDLTQAICLCFEKCKHVFMIPVDGRLFSMFEIEIIFENAAIRWKDSGLKIEERGISKSKFGPYNSIGPVFKSYDSALRFALLRLLGNAIDYLRFRSPLGCTGGDALAIHEIIEFLRGK